MNDLAAIIFSRIVTKPLIVKFLHGRPKRIGNIHKQAMSAHTQSECLIKPVLCVSLTKLMWTVNLMDFC